MGLDGVEIVMTVEETFGIAIEDSEAAKTVTPGRLIDLVLSKTKRTTDEACLTQRAFHRLRASLMRRLGVPRHQIKPDALLGSLFPRPTRRDDFRQISHEIGVGKEIEFVRPTWLMSLILTVIFSGGIAAAVFFASHTVTSQNFVFNIVLWPLPIVAGALFIASFGWLACLATSSMRIEFQPSVATIGHLSRWIVVNAPEVVKAHPGPWSREQVSEIIREIVIDKLGCEKEYREDAHFVKDLGLV